MPTQTDTNLFEQMIAPENLLSAWRAVRGNIPRYRRQRSAGPDGVTLAEFERDLVAQLRALRHMLLHDRYRPQTPGLFSLPKPDGGMRQIAVLNVVDRVAQRAAQQVIEPLVEPRFLPCSFGFRPGRSLQDAVYCVRRTRGSGYAWVVDGDIAACFDSLDHTLLAVQLRKHIPDSRLVGLIQQWLETGIIEHGLPVEETNWLEHGWQQVTGGLQRGADWAIHAMARAGDPLDEYLPEMPRPAHLSYLDKSSREQEGHLPAYLADDVAGVPPASDFWQQQAVQQLALGGLAAGGRWARDALGKAGPAALAALKTPAGQVMLKRALLAGGGLVGAAAGVAITAGLVHRQVSTPAAGVLQGSPLSPLLANIYLNSFDVALTRAGYRMVRYADDWVILCPDQDAAERSYNQATIALARLRLKLNLNKTRILKPGEPLNWLGAVIE